MGYFYFNAALLTLASSVSMAFGSVQENYDEEALYAVSSLEYFLSEMQQTDSDEKYKIAFDESDIESLWHKAESSSLQNEVLEAKALYTESFFCESANFNEYLNKSKDILGKIWNKLRKKASVEAAEKIFITNETPVDYSSYILPQDHPTKPHLDAIFKDGKVLQSFANMKKAGFEVISERPSSMKVLYHPSFPKYLIKVYPHNERNNWGLKDVLWAYRRCAGAENIRELIKQKNLKHFSVPRKWIYFVPNKDELAAAGSNNCVVLVVDYMKVVERKESSQAWLKADRKVLKELYCILSQGYSSCLLYRNIPYTKSGKFTCIDTENIQRFLPYNNVKKHISPKLHRYWDRLVRTGGNTPGFNIK